MSIGKWSERGCRNGRGENFAKKQKSSKADAGGALVCCHNVCGGNDLSFGYHIEKGIRNVEQDKVPREISDEYAAAIITALIYEFSKEVNTQTKTS